MLEKEITALKGIGAERAKLFAQRGIHTVEDLLYYFPRDYEDRSRFKQIDDCEAGETACVRAAVFSPVKETRIRRNLTIYSLVVHDETNGMTIVWYNNRFVKGAFIPGEEYIFYGKISINRGKREMVNPIYEKQGKERFTGKIVPLYPLSAQLSQKMVQSAMEYAVEYTGELEEYLPADIREQYHIAEIGYAMQNIHFPADFACYDIARRRFVFEELLIFQLALLTRKEHITEEHGPAFVIHPFQEEFVRRLPFRLTSAQARVLDEICMDLEREKPMNRLVQGDVGSGKTAVAAASAYVAVKNGWQSAVMAPTEILAKQHYDTFLSFFQDTDTQISLLTGSMRATQKKEIYQQLKDGQIDILIGTHAIIQNDVNYRKLGLVIADEQHRFGVNQRAALSAKGQSPNMLIMSATPIPRTLALILYGDLDISVIDELPPGRKTVKTYAVNESMRKRAYSFMEKNISMGTQAYIVCPLVEETENSDLKNASALAEKLQSVFPHLTIGLIHGKMKQKDKEEIMRKFQQGEVQALVATTVIEVGVNVPNSTLMIIENAERFGLSQLHQLRGRVGRGGDQAYCILITNANSDITKKRMQTMCSSNDGFYISEQDLALRGPGDFFGTRQHGLPALKIANLFEDSDILSLAQSAAKEIYQKDKRLEKKENQRLKQRIQKIFYENIILN